METRDLLLEIGTEEIPARMVEQGCADLDRLVIESLDSAGLSHDESTTYCTPRRLAVFVSGIPIAQEDREQVALGPSVAVAFDKDGVPTRAAQGFARAQGVDVSSLTRVPGPKGEVVAVRKPVSGRRTLDLLSETLPAAIRSLQFPRSMRWADGVGPFVRPIHWICCLFGPDIVPFEFAGVKSGRSTRGHRFACPGPFEVDDPFAYLPALRDASVNPFPADRREGIIEAMAEVEAVTGTRFISNEGLLAEVSNLVESPFLVVGKFDPDFLRLPREVLITAMAAHQRYFAMEDSSGNLQNTFGVVSNTAARDMAVVIRGYERVLAARLYDARFFFQQDLKVGIEAMVGRLGQRLFLKGAGDMLEKARRVADLASKMFGMVQDVEWKALDRAAELCKADLMSGMVGEFPELQGVMGMYYARAANEPEEVATAIREHYLPRFAGDELPESTEGAVLAVADRLDSIVTCFKVGAIPTGSQDPLALRRQAIGILKILIDRRWDLALRPLLEKADQDRAKAEQLIDFFRERFHGILTSEYDVPADFANAVLDQRMLEDEPPFRMVDRAIALRDIAKGTEDFRDFLANVYKRVFNILKKADQDLPSWQDEFRAAGLHRNNTDYTADLPTELDRAVESLRVSARRQMTAVNHSFPQVLSSLYSFKDPLARFFGSGRDGVPVLICEDADLRLKRLALLQRVLWEFSWFADFSKISTR